MGRVIKKCLNLLRYGAMRQFKNSWKAVKRIESCMRKIAKLMCEEDYERTWIQCRDKIKN